MVNLINKNIDYFYKDIKNKKLYMFGAGKAARYLCDEYHLDKHIDAIIDNNSILHNTKIKFSHSEIEIISIEKFINIVKHQKLENMVLIISSVYFAWKIIEQIDDIQELDGLNVYIGRLIDDCVDEQKFEFTKGRQLIPRKIHYCWFGYSPIPSHLLQYIESWKRCCPGYEIIRWDESNYDVTKNRYMREAYERKKWGFVPDYARLDIIYREGGIYLDTDVELLSSLDKLLCDKMFCGFASGRMVNFGLGFGAYKGNELIRELRDIYEEYTFLDSSGKENLTACSWYEHSILEKHDFKINGKYQKKEGNVIYPPEVLSPLGASMIASNFTANTISIHHAELSWVTLEEKLEFMKFQENIGARLAKYQEDS